MTTIGVLALQGDFLEHETVLCCLGAVVREVRLPRDLEGLDGLVLPGGESTTFDRLIGLYELREPLLRMAASGAPVWGTCAGLIVLARQVEGRAAPVLGPLDVTVQRNAYGRQVDSFETDLDIPALGEARFHAIFIRAPKIVSGGKGVQVLARTGDGTPVAVRQGNLLGTTFHPELTEDPRLHAYFLHMAKERIDSTRAASR